VELKCLPLILVVPSKLRGVEKVAMTDMIGGGIAVDVIVGRWYCPRLLDVGCGWSVREGGCKVFMIDLRRSEPTDEPRGHMTCGSM
jgi:hypothetical protein